ncbi:hypothetical protein [Planococcus lenghuensis]|uniref:O-antigen ligase domain-containing protein n=1 Tax=Planococcus lenghuensis TaxID=2213202 RepID=A0A1Q2L2T8_9BACL|nr:hypothetical protein [Planococcus lenghuensis]AQQ54202.1 hypothetical protein B0X71_14565 [Planococcus lenghuensis]
MNILKIYDVLPYALIISSFGFYIIGGLRIEHLILYPIAVILIGFAIRNKLPVFISHLFIHLLWLFLLIVAILATLIGNGEYLFIKALADMESFIQPLVVISIFMFAYRTYSIGKVENNLILSCKILLFLLSLNTLFIFISLFVDISEVGKHFWGSEDSVAARAATNGRYSGIFNQPLEAGVMYSLGLLCWIYISGKMRVLKINYITSLFLILIGGLITVSKIFLFGGIFLFLVGILFSKKKGTLVFWLINLSVIVGSLTYIFLLKQWSGLNYLLRFFNSSDNWIKLLTAGRFGGEDSQQVLLFNEVWKESPFFGRGFGQTPVYDSGYFQFFAVGGSIGFTLFILLLLYLSILSAIFIKQNRFQEESKFFLLINLLIIGSSIGSPTLTLNRVSLVMWIFIVLLLQFFHIERVDNNKITEAKTKKS